MNSMYARRINLWTQSQRSSFTRLTRATAYLGVLWASILHTNAQTFLGDLDADSRTTILDLTRLNAHLSGAAPLSGNPAIFADLTQDERIDDADREFMIDIIMGRREPPQLALTTILRASPADGEGDVAVTRETVLRFTAPLHETATIGPSQFFAEFGGETLSVRRHISPDRRSIALFYTETLPASARIRVTFVGDGILDERGLGIDPDFDGVAGGIAQIDFDTLTLSGLPNTAVCGRIFASDLEFSENGSEFVNRPLPGVTISIDGTTRAVVTDANGDFRIDNAPAGEFFVHIDGRTVPNVEPAGAYYPNVGKKWTSVPGQETNLEDIYLPLIPPDTLQPVSETEDTPLEFDAEFIARNPKFDGVRVTVPANSLFSDDGTRGGSVGIAPVQPDRLPGALSSDLPIQDVVTIQTDGATNFDAPAPICLPNLADPTTGERLAPGAKAALWSFNHDIGRFEIVGSMTVSDDGRLICTDEGVGVEAPGWHGSADGTQGEGGTLRTIRRKQGDQEKPGKHDPAADPDNQIKIPCPDNKNKYIVLYKNRRRPPANAEAKGGDPVYLHSGEFYENTVDLRIPGRGMDFIWMRKYRSKIGTQSAQGNNWDFSYNVFIEPVGEDFLVCDGNSRADIYEKSNDGTWTAPGFFRILRQLPNGAMSLTFESLGEWRFHPFDGRPEAGKIATILDRNRNAMRFEYDALGRLSRIIDTLERPIQIAYNPEGFIESVTDFTNRTVQYTYYGPGESGGNPGDLKSARSPVVNGTPTGNDFPDGKTLSYTYSTGFAEERLNGNLLTITDGRRNDPTDPTFRVGPYLVNQYAPTNDPNDPQFDRIIRQVWGDSDDILDYAYAPMRPSNANGRAVIRTIVNDRKGHVKEYFYDESNRLVIFREFTGTAIPDQPTTPFTNRPQNPLRPEDPRFFQTRFEWNADSLIKRTIYPNGNIQEAVYESDLNPQARTRFRSNLVATRLLPGRHNPTGDQEVIVETYEYDTQFQGCCGFNFITRHTDGRGEVTTHQYDSRGNRTRTVHRDGRMIEDFEYNRFGQLTAHIHPDNNGQRRRDERKYYESGPQKGYLRSKILDVEGFALETIMTYDAVGNIASITDPKGATKEFVYNSLDQLVREISRETSPGSGVRYTQDYHYDANDNIIRVDAPNILANGTLSPNPVFTTTYEYEILNHRIRRIQEVDESNEIVTEYEYDANRNRTLIRHGEATNGNQPNNTTTWVYDERDLVFRLTRAEGDANAASSEFVYDGNENIIEERHGIEADDPHITTRIFDGYDRPIDVTDPMGNVTQYNYDPNHNLVHFIKLGELQDIPGSTSNVRLFEERAEYDALNRQILRETEFFRINDGTDIHDGATTIDYTYNNAGLLTREEDDNGNVTVRAYDSMYRPMSTHDPMGNAASYVYDGNSNIVQINETDRSDSGQPDATFTQTFELDGLDRMIRHTDNVGNIVEYGYDSRNNRTRISDANRIAPDQPGNIIEMEFDGLRRLARQTMRLTDSGDGSGAATDQIVTENIWDDSGRLTGRIDDNGNQTTYTYDALDRMIRIDYADGSSEQKTFDPHNNPIQWRDANNSLLTYQYDLLNRKTRCDITPGPGVSDQTTFEVFEYDGYSRLTRASDDDSTVLRAYDSHSRIIEENLNGITTLFAYDGMRNQTQCVYPSGYTTTFIYDANNRVTRIEEPSGMVADPSYFGSWRQESCLLGNGTRTDYQYDGDRRRTAIVHSTPGGAPFESLRYEWDGMNNRASENDLLNGEIRRYTYDSIYRLMETSDGENTLTAYTYDGVGNRLSITGGPSAGAYVLQDEAQGPADREVNQYTQTPFGSQVYDSKGNLIQIAPNPSSYTFDYRNQLVGFEDIAADLEAEYQYDPLGRRIRRDVDDGGSTQSVLYYYDEHQVIEERDQDDAVIAQYVYLNELDTPALRRTPTDLYFYHSDDVYNIQSVTDASGSVVEQYAYDDFGAPRIFSPSGASRSESQIGNPYLFQGRRYDPESEFYYFRTRYLNPLTGRFISRDSLGIWGDGESVGNGYTFAGNNPTSRIDPMGTDGFNPQPPGHKGATPRRSPYDEATPTGSIGHFHDRPIGSDPGVGDAVVEWGTRIVSVLGYVVPDVMEPNMVYAHEHYFEGAYDESTPKEGHYGFGVGYNASEYKSKYNWQQSGDYYDDVMGMARDMIWNRYYEVKEKTSPGGRQYLEDVNTYSTFGNNCQDFADDLRSWYDLFLKVLCDESGSGLSKATDRILRDMWVSRFGDVDVVIETD